MAIPKKVECTVVHSRGCIKIIAVIHSIGARMEFDVTGFNPAKIQKTRVHVIRTLRNMTLVELSSIGSH